MFHSTCTSFREKSDLINEMKTVCFVPFLAYCVTPGVFHFELYYACQCRYDVIVGTHGYLTGYICHHSPKLSTLMWRLFYNSMYHCIFMKKHCVFDNLDLCYALCLTTLSTTYSSDIVWLLSNAKWFLVYNGIILLKIHCNCFSSSVTYIYIVCSRNCNKWIHSIDKSRNQLLCYF